MVHISAEIKKVILAEYIYLDTKNILGGIPKFSKNVTNVIFYRKGKCVIPYTTKN
jgi:hypothetical protein